MINNKTVLAVIPARGGSKRCPRKNIKEFRGKPLLCWTIDAAKESKHIDMVRVSTEDSEIMSMVCNYGVLGIDRPQELATDDATNEAVCCHALQEWSADIIVLLQPTSPLRTAGDIDTCLRKVVESRFPVVSYDMNGKKNGAVYACTSEWLLAGGNFHMHYSEPYFMDVERSLDIDYEEQFNG